MNIIEEISKLNGKIEQQKEQYQIAKQEYNRIIEEAKIKAASFEEQMKSSKKLQAKYLDNINSLKEKWVVYSLFSVSSGIAYILDNLIRTIEGDNSLSLNINSDIQFYDTDLNWVYETDYAYVKMFVDEIITVRFEFSKIEIDEKFLSDILDAFLAKHQNLIKIKPAETQIETISSNISTSLDYDLFTNLISIEDEIEKAMNELNSFSFYERNLSNRAYLEKKEELERLKIKMRQYSKMPNEIDTLIFILCLIEGEEYTYKSFRRPKEERKRNPNPTSYYRIRPEAICKVERFVSGGQIQTKYIPALDLTFTSNILNIKNKDEVNERYPYISEFIKMYINVQYTTEKLKLNIPVDTLLNMTIRQFMIMHQDIISTNFGSTQTR